MESKPSKIRASWLCLFRFQQAGQAKELLAMETRVSTLSARTSVKAFHVGDNDPIMNFLHK